MKATKSVIDAEAIYLDASVLPKLDLEDGPAGRAVRLLAYGGTIPLFLSFVSLGEFFAAAARKNRQDLTVNTEPYLYACRHVMKLVDLGAVHRVEPPEGRQAFVAAASRLAAAYSDLGGGDVWHLMAFQELSAVQPGSVLLSFDKRLVRACRAEGGVAAQGSELEPDSLLEGLQRSGRWKGGSGDAPGRPTMK